MSKILRIYGGPMLVVGKNQDGEYTSFSYEDGEFYRTALVEGVDGCVVLRKLPRWELAKERYQ